MDGALKVRTPEVTHTLSLSALRVPIAASLQLLIGLVFYVHYYADLYNDAFNFSLREICTAGTIASAMSLFLYIYASRKLISPYVLFLASFLVFQFGQGFLYTFHVNYQYYLFTHVSTDNYIPYDIVYYGTIYTILGICAFNFGAIFMLLNSTQRVKQVSFLHNKPVVRRSALLMFVVTGLVAVPLTIYQAYITIHYGYGLMSVDYTKEMYGPFIAVVVNLFFPSGILYLVYSLDEEKTKSLSRMVFFVLALYSCIGLASGTRTMGIAGLITLASYKTLFLRKIGLKRLVQMILVLICVLTIIPAISAFRDLSTRNTVSGGNNPFVSTIGELGGTESIIFMVMQIVPSHENYGDSYLATAVDLVPSTINPVTLFWSTKGKTELDAWLTQQYNSWYGLGFTLIAESYYNFGRYGFFAMIFIGMILGRILHYRARPGSSPFSIYIPIAVLNTCFTLPRRDMYYLVNNLIYVILLTFIYLYVMSLLSKKNA